MADIQNPRLLYIKGTLFLGVGILASVILLLQHPSPKTAALLAVAVWAFARAYYFAFYVIEHYIDPGTSMRGSCRSCGIWRGGEKRTRPQAGGRVATPERPLRRTRPLVRL
jgi:hypothetical protein